jgi:hypothetical protein
MSDPRHPSRKSHAPTQRTAREDARAVAASASERVPRAYPSAEELFAPHSMWRSQVAGALRTWLGPAALAGAVGLAGCGGAGNPPVTEPDPNATPSTEQPPLEAEQGHPEPGTPGQMIQPDPNAVPLAGAPMPVQPPSPPPPGPQPES